MYLACLPEALYFLFLFGLLVLALGASCLNSFQTLFIAVSVQFSLGFPDLLLVYARGFTEFSQKVTCLKRSSLLALITCPSNVCFLFLYALLKGRISLFLFLALLASVPFLKVSEVASLMIFLLVASLSQYVRFLPSIFLSPLI